MAQIPVGLLKNFTDGQYLHGDELDQALEILRVAYNSTDASVANALAVGTANETARTTAENGRVTAETTRSSSETTRVGNETTRIANENTRIASENSRISTENLRVTAENARVSAETSRVNSESARSSAENIRQINTASAISNVNSAVNTAITKWLNPVASYALIVSTYATPSNGDTVQCLDNGYVYRFNGTAWIYTQGYSATALANLTTQITDEQMFPDINYIILQGKTVGNIVLTRTKVALGTITLSI